MNKVFMVGRLAGDPQQFITKNGITQSRLSIASSDNWNRNETYFFPCVAWQTTANYINTYLKKGDLVAIDGKLIRRSYVSKEGNNVYVMEVVIETIKPLSSSKTSSSNFNDHPSSMDENIRFNEKPLNQSINYNDINESTNINEEFSSNIQEKQNNPFAINETTNIDEDDEIVNLDWLKDFSN